VERKVVAETEYIAVSHVWGDAKWRTVKGIDCEVMASEEKVEFMEERLPAIIGDQDGYTMYRPARRQC
jgi:hypothetical protein